MPHREYFYRDNAGKIKKFAYCCLCGAGPFKRTQKDFEYIISDSKSETAYCLNCIRELKLKMEDLRDKSSMVANETVEVIDFLTLKKSRRKNKYPNTKEILKDSELIEEIKKDVIRYDEIYEEKEKLEEADKIGTFYIYVGQYCDDTYKVGITENLEEELEKINSGTNPNFKKLPIELLYYHMVTSWKKALYDKKYIINMSENQKEELINKFIKEIFEK